ncbi:rubredoxin-like domain-containing protein [Clostridium paraputrificum]
MCTNCGYIYEGKEYHLICLVCSYLQEYYMDFSTKEYE